MTDTDYRYDCAASDFAGAFEDVSIALCLRDVGVLADSKLSHDDQGKLRMLLYPRHYEMRNNPQCCSAKPLVFHQYKTIEQMEHFFPLLDRLYH